MQQQYSNSTIQDFNILEKLGEGSFSSVYKVQRKSDGQYYAMKKVNISQQSLKERENALNEIRILASLDSPYIVEFKDAFIDQDGRILYVIMELASGGDLNQIVKQGKLQGGVQETEIWNILTQITLGVKILHDNSILHRDLKSANVFVSKTPQGNIYKIGDLNISKVTHGANAKTQTGTPYYAAPEVWKGEQYSWPCDIWSIGCIIYELITFQPPFRAPDLLSLNKKIQAGYYEPIPSKFSQDLQDIIKLLLQVDPLNRPNCDQILKNPKVIKNSGSLLVEIEQNGIKQAKLLQTIKLPFNLKQLKDNLPKPKYENRIKRSHSSQGLKIETDNPISQQPKINLENKEIKEQPLRKKLISVPSQGAPLNNKPPLAKPQCAQAQKFQYHPQTPQYQGLKIQYQEQKIQNQGQQYSKPTYLKQNYGIRDNSPRNNLNPYLQQRIGQQQPQYNMGKPTQMKRQYSAGIYGRQQIYK
ncbi:unnamed protein product [Paramecium sonneborni]|uniref:non-specific serine/threonine protein kinase n=1 Tax=Paramecium sonneborni TaxID=65129 RepID=A0A8S1R864_9CILI|nr:unnamed protein product [Paramecium sonneborni]